MVPDRSTAAILDAYARRTVADGRRRVPEGWDGQTAGRIADVFAEWLEGDRAI